MNHLKFLIQKLSPPTHQALKNAINYSINQMNNIIDIEHLFLELLTQKSKNDLYIILENNHINIDQIIYDLKKSNISLPQEVTQSPIFSQTIIQLFEHAWLLASTESSPLIRSGHLLIALFTILDLSTITLRISKQFELLSINAIQHKFLDLCIKSSEQAQTKIPAEHSSNPLCLTHHDTASNTFTLDQYTVNLTQKAQQGAIDPVIGREHEIRLMLDILMRRRQNNPILTGEPGVGKTAIVEGLALKIVQGLVPNALKNVQIHSLDIGLLQAGASVKGEFENRLKQVIQAVQASLDPIILFIDEAHTLIGAGGQAGQTDAANLLKPALARGELRTIAATTWSEYKQFFEKDAALSRRFQVIQVTEPTEAVAIDMLRAMLPVIQNHFHLHIEDQAVITAVQASQRYMSGRYLPDKAMSVLDTAAARVTLSQNAQPAILDQLQAQQHNLQLEQQILQHEHQQTPIHHERLDQLQQQLHQLKTKIQEITIQWQQELVLVKKIQALNHQETSPTIIDQQQITSLRDELKTLQGKMPLVFECVNSQMVHKIISDWTGIPLGNMVNDEIQHILSLENKLAQRIMGQAHALSQLVQGIKTSKAKLEDPNKPQGVFLLVGPSGVGKTETALALADELYGGEQHLITVNMSEYQEAHTVSSLKGAPPGYIGYGQGGVLTEAVRRNPYSVVLLDEIEKAHPDVQELFYQVFDKGCLEDGEGRMIDFKNTTILLTSNVGSSKIMQACLNQPVEIWPTADQLIEQLKSSLYKQFKPAFLGRMRIVPYYPLHDDLLVRIIHHKLTKIMTRIEAQYTTIVRYSDDLIEFLLNRCTQVDSGARNIDHILNSSVLPTLATKILMALVEQQLPQQILIDVHNHQICYQFEHGNATENNPTTITQLEDA